MTLKVPVLTYSAPREAPTVSRSSKRGSTLREPELMARTSSLTSSCLKPKAPPSMIPPRVSSTFRLGAVTISPSTTMAICLSRWPPVNLPKSL